VAGRPVSPFPRALFRRDFVKALDDPEAPDAMDLLNIPDTVDEFTITYSKVFLGLNLGCISCHDGKNHLEKVNVFMAGKKREDFFRQAGFFGKTRQIMNWEKGEQANQEYTVDDDAPGYNTKAESIVRMPRSGGSRGAAVYPHWRGRRFPDAMSATNWRGCLPLTFSSPALSPIGFGLN
jgi:hypothetical protein